MLETRLGTLSTRSLLPKRAAAIALTLALTCTVPGSTADVLAQAVAPSGEVLTLDQAIAIALQNNRMIQVARLDVEKAAEDVAVLRSRRRPQFDLNVLEGSLLAPLDLNFKAGAFGVFPATGPIPLKDTKVTTDPSLSTVLFGRVTQPLTQLHKISLGTRALELGREIAQEKVRAQEQSVVDNVKRVYYGLVQAQSGLSAGQESLKLYAELERVVGQYVERQVVLRSESLTVQTGLARQEQQNLVLANTVASLTEQMNVLLGRDVSSNFTVTPLLEAMPIDFDLAAARARAVAQRPEIRDARLKEQQAGYDLRLKRFEMYPELSVSFNYLGLYGMQVLPGQIAMLGVQGSWEPWDWGRNTREVAVKSRTLEQARLGVSEAEALISADVSSQLRKVQEAQMLLKVVRLNQESSREKLRVTTEQFRREAALTKDVLQAQTTLSEADQQYQRALAAFWTARADFEKSMGQSQ